MSEDTTKHQGRRRQLIDILKDKGINDKAVLKAIGDIPRHLFMDSSFEDHAYQDKAFPIGADQTISQPYTVAFQSQQLMVAPGAKVLEIGTGSGYQTAVLCHMGAVVYSIERHHELFRTSLKRLSSLGFKVKKLIFGDGYKGFPQKAPFDRIMVTAAPKKIPDMLVAQIKNGGKMIIPFGENSSSQYLWIIEKDIKGNVEEKKILPVRFVPMVTK